MFINPAESVYRLCVSPYILIWHSEKVLEYILWHSNTAKEMFLEQKANMSHQLQASEITEHILFYFWILSYQRIKRYFEF
jgi:hypothetical protein